MAGAADIEGSHVHGDATGLRIPITLLTGFLGAGKTARLNATLAAGVSRVAVIENEIGSLGVDGALVANTHDDGVVELVNGCLCCSAEVDLIATLEGLAHRRAARPFDRVIIETTGLADITPVVALLKDQDDPLAEDFFFDGVVTIVDTARLCRWVKYSSLDGTENDEDGIVARSSGFSNALPSDVLGLGDGDVTGPAKEMLGLGKRAALTAFWRQVALADQVVLSKVDLVGDQDVQEAKETIATMNPLGEIVVDTKPSEGGAAGLTFTPLAPRIGHRSASQAREKLAPNVPLSGFCGASVPKRRRGKPHLDGVDAFTFRLPRDRPLRAEPLRALATGLLAGSVTGFGPARSLGEAWRVKGLVVVEGEGAMLLQGVGDQLTLDRWERVMQDGPFLVVIGEGLQREQIEEILHDCSAETQMQLPDGA